VRYPIQYLRISRILRINPASCDKLVHFLNTPKPQTLFGVARMEHANPNRF